MSTLRLTLETITPLFLRGHDNRTPELRPPSVKGMLRYWWRASQVLPVPQLHDEEAALFGSAGGEESGRSTIQIRIPPADMETGAYPPLPHKNNFRREAFRPGQRFDVLLRRGPRCPVSLDQIQALARLAFTVGGLGMRSRRGFGAVRVTAIDGTPVESSDTILPVVREALFTLNDGFQSSDGTLSYHGDGEPPYPWIRRVEESDWVYDEGRTAVTRIANVMHEHDSQHTGNALGQRFASPLAVSVAANDEHVWPVLTTLHVPDETKRKLRGRDTRDAFRHALLHE